MSERTLSGDVRLFIPDGFRPDTDGACAVTWHLHGATATVREAFVRSRRRGALLALTLPGLSGIYTQRFSADPAGAFFDVLDEARRALGVGEFSSVWVSSFSAGFGAVREMLRAPTVYQRIDTLILADALYAGFARPQRALGDRPEPAPEHLKDFVRFARDAAERRDRALLVTYCDLLPPTYAATRETAEALRRAVGATNEARHAVWTGDLVLTAQARRGRFVTLGFSGDDGLAHLRHLRGLGAFYRLAPRV